MSCLIHLASIFPFFCDLDFDGAMPERAIASVSWVLISTVIFFFLVSVSSFASYCLCEGKMWLTQRYSNSTSWDGRTAKSIIGCASRSLVQGEKRKSHLIFSVVNMLPLVNYEECSLDFNMLIFDF